MRKTPRHLPGGLMAARAARAGFTLVEIAMVVLLLGLMIMVVVVAGYLGFRDTEQLKDEARQLAGFLSQVRTLSAIQGKRFTVEYNLGDEQQYFVWRPRNIEPGEVYEETDDDEARAASGVHQMPTRVRGDGSREFGVWIDRIGFGDGTSTQDTRVRIDFMPTGGSHWHMVYLTNASGEFYTISVNPFTGATEVYPGEYKPPEPERLR